MRDDGEDFAEAGNNVPRVQCVNYCTIDGYRLVVRQCFARVLCTATGVPEPEGEKNHFSTYDDAWESVEKVGIRKCLARFNKVMSQQDTEDDLGSGNWSAKALCEPVRNQVRDIDLPVESTSLRQSL